METWSDATPARKEFPIVTPMVRGPKRGCSRTCSTVGPTRKDPEAGSWRSTTRGDVTWDSVATTHDVVSATYGRSPGDFSGVSYVDSRCRLLGV
jgi:hypothetical protein